MESRRAFIAAEIAPNKVLPSVFVAIFSFSALSFSISSIDTLFRVAPPFASLICSNSDNELVGICCCFFILIESYTPLNDSSSVSSFSSINEDSSSCESSAILDSPLSKEISLGLL